MCVCVFVCVCSCVCYLYVYLLACFWVFMYVCVCYSITFIFISITLYVCLLTTTFHLVSEIYHRVTDSMRNNGNIVSGEWRLSVGSPCICK